MADAIQITGKVTVKVLVPGEAALEILGESEDMANVEERAFWHNVPGDRHGGPQGPPIDIQYLGAIAIVTLQLSRWDSAVFDKVRQRGVNAALGTVALGEVGTLMLENNAIRLVLDSPIRPLNFPACIVREATRIAMGTKYTSAICQFEAHRNPADGILFDDDIADPPP